MISLDEGFKQFCCQACIFVSVVVKSPPHLFYLELSLYMFFFFFFNEFVKIASSSIISFLLIFPAPAFQL